MNPLMVSCQLKQSIIGAINVRTWRENILHSYTPESHMGLVLLLLCCSLTSRKTTESNKSSHSTTNLSVN